MSRDINNPAFKKLLQKLQEESWQLELLISGFAIFGLFTASEPVEIIINEAKSSELIYRALIFTFLKLSIAILLLNLLLHVILRGLWIGALGLRYVSGDIDYEALNYSPKFTKYLRNKIGSFDKYIATLENYCSIIFAISFLLIFYILAFAFTMITITAIAEFLLDNESIPKWLGLGLGIPMILFVTLGMLLTFIDFLTLGFLKRKKWISKIYFPIYWVFSFITLSFLYRPLVYNFLDNKFGKRISIILVPIYVLLLVVTSIEDKQSNYFEKSNDSSEYYASKRNYEDMLTEEGQFIKIAAIPSKAIKESHLKIFIVFSDRIEDRMFLRNEGLKPEKDKRGLYSDIIFTTSSDDRVRRDSLRNAKDSLKIEYIRTFNTTYKVYIDSIHFPAEFVLGESTTKQFGFESYVDIKNLSVGKHNLRLKRDRFTEKDTTEVSFATIPFWHFKEY